MTQDVVTAQEVESPDAPSSRLPDAQRIVEKLNEALVKESFDQSAYSNSVQSLLQQAWAVAAAKHSTQVTTYHLAYALVFDHPEAGKTLAERLETDADSFAAGCILRILSLGVSAGDADIVPPAVGTVRWVGEAVALARERGKRCELLPEDLVRAILDDGLPASQRNALRRAARVGKARLDAVIGTRSVPSIVAVPSSSRDIIQHMEEVAKGYPRDPEDGVSDLNEERYRADVKGALARIEGRISALDTALPRAPSGARLTAAIAAVLILGIAAGLALALAQPGSRLAQVFAVNVK